MYEHYENYDRYIPDVMLKKHRKHEEYLSDKYKGMTHQEIYQSKLGTVEDAHRSHRPAETASSGPSTPAQPRLFLRQPPPDCRPHRPPKPVELWSCVARWAPSTPFTPTPP